MVTPNCCCDGGAAGPELAKHATCTANRSCKLHACFVIQPRTDIEPSSYFGAVTSMQTKTVGRRLREPRKILGTRLARREKIFRPSVVFPTEWLVERSLGPAAARSCLSGVDHRRPWERAHGSPALECLMQQARRRRRARIGERPSAGEEGSRRDGRTSARNGGREEMEKADGQERGRRRARKVRRKRGRNGRRKGAPRVIAPAPRGARAWTGSPPSRPGTSPAR